MAGFVAWFGVLQGLGVFAAIATYMVSMNSFGIALPLLNNLQLRLGDHLVPLSLGWFGKSRAGATSTLATKGPISLASGAAHLITPLFRNVASSLTVVVVALIVDWRIGVGQTILRACGRRENYTPLETAAVDHHRLAVSHMVRVSATMVTGGAAAPLSAKVGIAIAAVIALDGSFE